MALHARRWAVAPLAQYVALPMAFLAFPLLTIVGVRFSEPMFLMLFAGAIVAADRPEVGRARGALAGVLAGLAALTRSIGVAAVVGIPVALWLRRQRTGALSAFIAAIATAAPWFIWIGGQADAVDPRIASNYGTYLAAAGQAGFVDNPVRGSVLLCLPSSVTMA